MPKQVYLTIDDGPSLDFIAKVDFLHQRHIPAVFFCIGENMEARRNDVAYAIRKGFLIGNHSYSHEYFSDLSIEEGKESIRRTDEIIDEIYKSCGIQRPIKVFRFPYFDRGGSISGKDYENRLSGPGGESYPRNDRRDALQAFLSELGYTQPKFKGLDLRFFNDRTLLEYIDVRCTFNQMEYLYGVENAPYGMGKEEAILGRIDEDAPYDGRALNCLETSDIILTHDHERTTELFYKIVNRYLEKSFEFLEIV